MRRLRSATLCRVRLETGRTHQIRIHLAERGHPLVGETVYIRDLRRAGDEPLSAPRLDAARGAARASPTRSPARRSDWTAPPPADFVAVLRSARRSSGDLLSANIRSALAAIVEAIRSAYGDNRPARAGSARTAATIPTFVERTAPLLEFLWTRYFRVRLLGIENVPGRRRGAAGRQPLGRHPLRRRDAAVRDLPRPPAPSSRAPVGGQLRLSLGLDGQRRRAHRLRARVDGDGVADAGARRPRRRVSRRSEGRRQAVSRAIPAGALRPRRLRPPGARRPRCRCCRSPIVGAEEIHPVIGKITRFAEPLGIPYIPITPTFPWLGPARVVAGPDEVDHPDRRADRAAGAGRRGGDDARRRAGSQRDRRR